MTTPAERTIYQPADADAPPAAATVDYATPGGPDARPPEQRVELGWLDALVQHRRVAFAIVALLYLFTFNGLWRVGVDSALYRGLGHSIATGHGYTFNGEHHRHAFFGVPYLLAGCEKLFGPDAVWPAQLLIVGMALATIWLTYRLMLLYFPIWLATIVAIGVGTNFRFVRLAQELMTDVPFALGVVATLYGLERMRLAPRGARATMLRSAALMIAGLVLAATTRPTIAVLAVAVVAASAVRAVRNRDPGRRALHLVICGVAAVGAGLFWWFQLRARGVSLTGGIYERELIERLQTLPSTILVQVNDLLGYSLNDVFFSQKIQPFSYPVALMLIAGAALVLRRNLLWGLLVVGAIAVTLPLSTAPRYYLMVLPILWLGWLLLLARLTLAAPPILRGAVMMVGVVVPIGMNVGRDCGLIGEQRAGDVAWLLDGKPRVDGFYAKYRDGEVPRLKSIADLIAKHAKPGQRVIGPEARILVYYSGRRVEGERELFEDVEGSINKYPGALERYAPDLAIFPSLAYGDNDLHLRNMIRRRILAPTGPVVGRAEGKQNEFIWLAKADVRPPPPGVAWKDWNSPDGDEDGNRGAADAPPKKKKKKPAATVVSTTAPTTAAASTRPAKKLSAEERAKRERVAKRAEAARRAEVAARQKAAAERKARAEAQARRERAAATAAKAEQQAKRDRQAAKDRKAAQAKKAAASRPSTP